MPIEITKEELESYLKEFIEFYRTRIRKEYPAYFNEFPFYFALKAFAVMTPNKVYFVFTRDGNPKRTTVEVLDENDIPELMRVKDRYHSKIEDIHALLGIETYIPDFVNDEFGYRRSLGRKEYFNAEKTVMAVDESISIAK